MMPGNDVAPVKAKWIGAFVATLLAMMTLQTASLGFSPLLPAIQHEFQMSFSQLGLFTGAYGLLAIVFSVPAGLLVKRFGERPVLSVGLVGVICGLGLLAIASSFGHAFVGRLVWIGGYRLAFVSVLAALASTCPPALRGRTMGILGAVSSLASVLGAPFGGKLSVHLGWRGGIAGFACLAGLGLVAFLIFYRRPVEPGRETGAPARTEAHAGVSAFRHPRVWALALFSGLVGIPAFGATFFAPSAARIAFHLDAVSTAWMISLGYMLAIVLNLLVGYLVDHYDQWVVLPVLVGCGVPCALAMNSQSLGVFRTGTALLIAISFSAVIQSYGLASEVLRGRQVGNVMGILSLGAGLTGYLGPQVLGILRDKTGSFAAGWYVMAAVSAVTCVELILLGRTAARTVASESTLLS